MHVYIFTQPLTKILEPTKCQFLFNFEQTLIRFCKRAHFTFFKDIPIHFESRTFRKCHTAIDDLRVVEMAIVYMYILDTTPVTFFITTPSVYVNLLHGSN